MANRTLWTRSISTGLTVDFLLILIVFSLRNALDYEHEQGQEYERQTRDYELGHAEADSGPWVMDLLLCSTGLIPGRLRRFVIPTEAGIQSKFS